MGTYRGALKATDRLGVRMASRIGGAGGYQHWLKHRKMKTPMPCAIVIGCAPVVVFTGPQKLAIDQDEMGVAGALAGEPIRTVEVRHHRPRRSGRFRDRHRGADRSGTARARRPVRREPRLHRARRLQHVDAGDRDHPQEEAGVRLDHQPGDAERKQRDQEGRLRADVPVASARPALDQGHPQRLAARAARQRAAGDLPAVRAGRRRAPRCGAALHGASTFRADCGKIVIAVSEDIDPTNTNAVFWSMAYRANPIEDVHVAPYRSSGHGPKSGRVPNDSSLLIDATLKHAVSAARPADKGIHGARAQDLGRDRPAGRFRRSRPGTATRSATGPTIGKPSRSAPSKAIGKRAARKPLRGGAAD